MTIVYYGGHRWDGAWFRKQQFAHRLSLLGHKVYYIEDSVSFFRKNKRHPNKYLKTQVNRINENLTIIIPSVFFLFPRKFFYRHLYNLKLLSDIKRILKKDKINDAIYIFNRLEFSTILNKINSIKIVDICDDIPFYAKLEGNENTFRNMDLFLKTALKNSNLGIVSAVRLKEKYQNRINNELITIPNGHSIDLEKVKKVSNIQKLSGISKPIVGFLGTLFKFTDHELLKDIIEKRPNYSFVFLGGIENNFPISTISNFSNVYLLGKVSKEDVPGYIKTFDVCINPFNQHEVNDSVNPVKVFEYLAMKKNVISTEMYSLKKEKIGKYIKFAKSKEDFLNILDKTIIEEDFVNKIPKSIIMEYHWDSLFEKFIEEINSSLNISL